MKIQTERTSKTWKALGFASLMLFGLGVGVCLYGVWDTGAVILMFAGALFFVARVGAWWNHG